MNRSWNECDILILKIIFDIAVEPEVPPMQPYRYFRNEKRDRNKNGYNSRKKEQAHYYKRKKKPSTNYSKKEEKHSPIKERYPKRG